MVTADKLLFSFFYLIFRVKDQLYAAIMGLGSGGRLGHGPTAFQVQI